MLKFTRPYENEREHLLKLTSQSLEGAEAYTFLSVHGKIPEEAFFCGRDEDGIKSLVFNNGDEDIRAYGSEFSEIFSFRETCLFIYEGARIDAADVKALEGSKILDSYRLICDGRLSFDDERRYVLRLKGVNAGLSKVFGVFSDDKLISVACVAAMNEKYGLIADVFTHPLFRCKGYSSAAVGACVNFILSRGRIPYLRCEEKMCDHYKKAGFTYYGKM